MRESFVFVLPNGRSIRVPVYDEGQPHDTRIWPRLVRTPLGRLMVRWGQAYARAFDAEKDAIEFCRTHFIDLMRGQHVAG